MDSVSACGLFEIHIDIFVQCRGHKNAIAYLKTTIHKCSDMTTPQLLKLIEYIKLDAICSSNVSNTEFYLPQIKKSVARIQWFPHIAPFKGVWYYF